MILHTLAQYHQQQITLGDPNYAPNGMELKRIHFVLVLTEDGQLIDIEQPEGKISVAKSRERGGKDAPLTANRMWDNVSYVTGYCADDGKQSVAAIQFRSFVALVNEIHCDHPDNRSFEAVNNFYRHDMEQLYSHPLWEIIISKLGHNLSFRLKDEVSLASQQEEILSYCSVSKRGRCIVSGHKSDIVHTHPKLHVSGCSPTGAKLVSFTRLSGYDSYCKRGGENAPTSVEITEGYSSALTGLLQPRSNSSIVIGDVTFLFYTLPDSEMNKLFVSLFGNNPDMSRQESLTILKNIASQPSDKEFVLIALVANVARLSVRLYINSRIVDVAVNILKFYEDVDIDNDPLYCDAMSLLTPLFAVARRDNMTTLSPQFIVDYMDAVICGKPLPVQFQQELLRRLSERAVRTSAIYPILRCYLIRNSKTHISMSLDTTNKNVGYILGRILAISERAQELSSPNLNFTIRDAFYSTISVTPSAVFNRIISLSGAFMRRIPTQGATIFIKSQFGDAIGMLDSCGVPVRLSLDEQSHFALGYFHQRQTYFKKRECNEQSN